MFSKRRSDRTGIARISAAVAAAVFTTGAGARAASIWSNTLDGTLTTSPVTTGNVVAANLTVSGIGVAPGMAATSANGRFNWTPWNTTSLATNHYFTWTLTPSSGFAIDFTDLTGHYQASNTGPASFSLQYSVDGGSTFTEALNGALTHNGNAQTFNYNLGASTLDNVTSPITFRLFGWGGSGSGGTYSINDFIFDGAINPVVVAGPSLFWIGGDSTVGGDGTWDNSTTSSWTAVQSSVSPIVFDSTKSAEFSGVGGNVTVAAAGVTVNPAVAGADLQFDVDGYVVSGGTITLGDAAPTINVTTAGATARISSQILSNSGLTKAGLGTLILDGNNSYSGSTNITVGTLQIGNGGTTGSITNDVNDNGTLAFNRSDDVTFSGHVSGNGAVNKLGPNTLTITSDFAQSGGTTLSAGTLQIGDGNSSGSLSGNVVNNGVLAVNRGNDFEFDGNMSGTGALNKLNNNTMTVVGNFTHTGGTTIAAGTLQIGTGDIFGSISGDIVNNGALIFNRFDNIVYNGKLSGPGSLTQAGQGKVTATGNLTHMGGTTISSGTLQIGNGGASGSLAGDVSNSGVLAFSRSDSTSFTGVISGPGAVIKSGAGALTLVGSNSYQGGTTVTAGTLVAANSNSLGNGSSTVSMTGGNLYARGGVTVSNPIDVSATAAGPALVAYFNFNNQTAGISGNPGTFNTTGTTEVFDPQHLTLSPGTAGTFASNAVADFSHLAGAQGTGWGTFAGDATNAFNGDANGGSLTVVGTGNNGRSVIFETPTTGFQDVVATYAYRSTSTGFLSETWSYSTDGVNFTPLPNAIALANDALFHLATADFTGITAIANQPLVYFQVTLAGDTSGTGNTRLDNLQFNAAGAAGSVVLGGDITSGSATFSGTVGLHSPVALTAAVGGPVVFSGVISDASSVNSVTKVGGGVVRLTNSNTYTGGTNVNEGTLAVGHFQALGSGPLAITGAAKVALNSSLGSPIILPGLTMSATSQLDLANNEIDINTSDPLVAGAIRNSVAAGFDSGRWDWPGIVSSTAAADPDFGTAVGIVFDGAQVRLKYTYYGDANLDGTVNAADFSAFLDGLAGGGTTWAQGDFTYDGIVDLGNDFNLFLSNFVRLGGSLGSLAGELESDSRLTAVQKAQLLAVVPEPSSLMAVGVFASSIAMRRKKRSR